MEKKPKYEELERRVQELETHYSQLEKKLYQARFFSEEIMTYMTEGLVLTDTRGTVIFINQRLSEMLGLLPEEIIGKSWLDMVPVEQQTIAEEAEARRVQGHTDRYEIILGHKDGHKFPVVIGAGPRFDKQDGQYIGTMGVVTDITERKQAIEALEEREAFIKATLDNLPVGVAVNSVEPKVHFSYMNENFAAFYRTTREALAAPNDFWEVVYTDATFREEIKKRVLEDCAGNDPERMHWEDVPISRPGKKPFYITAKNIPLPERDLMVSTVWDVTERKLAEEALRESEVRFKALHNASFGGIAIHDQGFILECNQGLSEMTGYEYSELVGMNGLLLIAERSRETVMNNIRTGYEKPYEAFGLRKNGEEFPMRLEARNVPYKGEQVRTVEFRDITEQKRADAENEKLQAQLIQSQKMQSVGRLAGGVAHDFNNMLGVIMGNTEMALDQADSTQPLHDNLQEIQKAAIRSTNVVRQLLAFARKQTIAPRVLDLNATVEEMLKMLRRLIGEDIDLSWQPGHDIWPVKMDPSQIDQILANLSVNARDAIAGVGKLTIETGKVSFDEAYCSEHQGFVSGDFVLLAVSDNGCGMDAETLKNLFEPFFTTKEVGKGTGLGLATVYGIAKQNNGFVNVYSEPDQGTTFKIYLPRHRTVDETTRPERADTEETHGSETILLVEDETTILKMTRMMLERLGYTVLTAATSGEAMDVARENSEEINLLMTDVVMPEMNGRDLAGKLLTLYPNLKWLFMSGYTANVIAHHGVLDEGVSFIQKPFSKQDLAAKVRKVLDEKD